MYSYVILTAYILYGNFNALKLSTYLILFQSICLRKMVNERCQNELGKNECRKNTGV